MFKLYNDDYLNILENIKCDLIITDPPYLHEKGGRGKMLLGNSLDRKEFNMSKLGDFGKESIYEFLNSTKLLMKKPQWYIFCSEKQIVYYLDWCVENKYKYNILTWNKPLSVMNRERFSTNIEYIIRIYGNGCALNKIDLDEYPNKTELYSKYIKINQIRGNTKLHPSQKPTEIIKKYLELSSKDGDVIFDPFMGSGSTGVSCLELNRSFIGCEKELDIFKVASDRINNTYNYILNV